jgi:hypothetical protein
MPAPLPGQPTTNETPPTPMPGAKYSAGDKPPVTGVNDSNSSRTAPPPPPPSDKDRGNALHDHIAAYFAPKETRTGPQGKTVTEAVNEAVAGAKGANPDY